MTRTCCHILPSIIAVFVLLAAFNARAEDYRLQPGDRLRLSLAGLPELDATATVDMNGMLVLPIAGRIQAAGRALADVELDVRTAVGGQAVKRYTEDGAPIFIGLSTEDARLTVDAFRPVFVSGFVRAPGPIDFQPGLSVRAALAAAGGLGSPDRIGENNRDGPLVERRLVALDRVARVVDLWRAQAELAEAADAPPPNHSDAETDAAFASALAIAQMQLNESLESLDARRRYVEVRLEQIAAREMTLRQQAENERATLEQDDQEFARVNDLFERGLVQIARLSDIRRSQLASATRVLQTESSLADLDFLREQIRRDLAEAEEARAQRLRGEIADAATAIRSLDARLAGLDATLIGVNTPERSAWRLVLHRQGNEGETSFTVTPGTALWPGDVLEVESLVFSD